MNKEEGTETFILLLQLRTRKKGQVRNGSVVVGSICFP